MSTNHFIIALLVLAAWAAWQMRAIERDHSPAATATRKQLRAWRRERLVVAIRNRWRT